MLKELSKYGISSVFFSTVYTKLYYLISSLTIVLTLDILPKILLDWNLITIISILTYTLMMILVYMISKKIKTKRNTLDIKRITVGKKLSIIVIMIIWTAVEMMMISAIQLWFIFKIN